MCARGRLEKTAAIMPILSWGNNCSAPISWSALAVALRTSSLLVCLPQIPLLPPCYAKSESVGTQAKRWLRYLHTCEAYGIVGQTIAGLASFAGIIMVWTGFALALRRFQYWLARNKN